MSEPDPESAPNSAFVAPPPVERSPALPLFVWLLIQLLALSLAALRVPLSARFPLPGEQFAIHVMLIAQIAASAMLFPFLMRNVRTSAIIILSIAPFVQLSGYLSSISIRVAALATVYVATWLLTLGLWRPILRTRKTEMFGVASALALSLGGTAIWYVRTESRAAGATDWPHDGLYGPMLGAVAQVHAAPATSWFAVLAWLGVSVTAYVVGSRRSNARLMREVGRSGTRPPGA